jgi:hypothetical protein
MVQLSRLLHLIAEQCDGSTREEDIAERVSGSYGKTVSPDNVHTLSLPKPSGPPAEPGGPIPVSVYAGEGAVAHCPARCARRPGHGGELPNGPGGVRDAGSRSVLKMSRSTFGECASARTDVIASNESVSTSSLRWHGERRNGRHSHRHSQRFFHRRRRLRSAPGATHSSDRHTPTGLCPDQPSSMTRRTAKTVWSCPGRIFPRSWSCR